MVAGLLLVGIAVAVFVGVNVGGASTGVAFGPATGAHAISQRSAAALMSVFALAGGVLVGPQVVDTLGTDFVPPEHFTLPASIAVLLFIGGTLLVSNLLGVAGSTSQTAVGAVVGMGVALGVLRYDTLGIVVAWWFLSLMFGFWVAALVGRHFHDQVVAAFRVETERGERRLELLVVGVGCFMAFSAGASNVANAVAPLVGSGEVAMLPAVALAGLSMGAGAFLLGPRTMETVGSEITPLTLEGSVVVAVLSALIIVFLSAIGIPASLAITTQACIMGFGWGRATREMPMHRVVGLRDAPAARDAAIDEHVNPYSVATTRRIVSMWLLTPVLAGLLAFVTFWAATRLGLLGV